MHIYAFGSICRGDIKYTSDIDLLALVDDETYEINPEQFSIYSYKKIENLWDIGNPFAWHLHKEASLIYASDNIDYIQTLKKPNIYTKGKEDCVKFYKIFLNAKLSLLDGNRTPFELATIFLALRNIAICYKLYCDEELIFSRNAILCINSFKTEKIKNVYYILEKAKILSSRGIGDNITNEEYLHVLLEIEKITQLLECIMEKVINVRI